MNAIVGRGAANCWGASERNRMAMVKFIDGRGRLIFLTGIVAGHQLRQPLFHTFFVIQPQDMNGRPTFGG
jgi:hypothetical protein